MTNDLDMAAAEIDARWQAIINREVAQKAQERLARAARPSPLLTAMRPTEFISRHRIIDEDERSV